MKDQLIRGMRDTRTTVPATVIAAVMAFDVESWQDVVVIVALLTWGIFSKAVE